MGVQRVPAGDLALAQLGADRLVQPADRARADQVHPGQRHRADGPADPLPRSLEQLPLPVQHLGLPRGALHRCLKAYFEFSKEHYKRTGYRINLLSVGYRILADQSSLFSYSYHGNIITFDPVSTGNFGWDTFLREYNALCSELGGTPLFNQTNLLTRAQVDKAFGDRMPYFEKYRQRYDPTDRLLNNFFRELLAPTEEI